jgi:hypothetical protein
MYNRSVKCLKVSPLNGGGKNEHVVSREALNRNQRLYTYSTFRKSPKLFF